MTKSIDEFLGAAKAPRLSVPINVRADLLARHAELKAKLDQAQREDLRNIGITGGKAAPAVEEEIAELEDEMADSEMVFVFEGLGHREYVKLLTQHPPSKRDKAANLDFNETTFPPALIAASCVEPEMTLEQATTLCDTITDGQFSKLWNVAIAVNVGSDAAPKSVRRSATVAPNGTSSTTAAPEESLDQSSSDEQ